MISPLPPINPWHWFVVVVLSVAIAAVVVVGDWPDAW